HPEEAPGMHDLCMARLNRARCASPLDQSIEEMAHRLGAPQPDCVRGAAAAGEPSDRRPPVLPAVFLLLGLLVWSAPLLLWRRDWLFPAVSLAGLLGMAVVLLLK
ncbi:hypothetical protein ACFL2F_04060, partial [Myxococcota bacterium]